MLKNISPIIPPDLLKYMAEMGHGDELVLADANFPGTAIAKRVIRCDGIDMPILLNSVLALLPIDDFVERPVALMNVAKGESAPAIWKTFEDILNKHDMLCLKNGFELIDPHSAVEFCSFLFFDLSLKYIKKPLYVLAILL